MSTPTVIDVRSMDAADRQALIFSRFASLQPGESIHLLHDHDPQALFQQFQIRQPDAFDWQVQARGPSVWQVSIKRRAGGACCGCCGGH